jgi:hypothetical protein
MAALLIGNYINVDPQTFDIFRLPLYSHWPLPYKICLYFHWKLTLNFSQLAKDCIT